MRRETATRHMTARLATIVLLAFLAAACTARSLDDAQTRFDTLAAEAARQSSPPPRVTGPQAVSPIVPGGTSTALLDLATTSAEAAEKASGPTRVAFWRVAALSAWQAATIPGADPATATNAVALVDRASRQGAETCGTLGANAPVRDCALVTLAPAFVLLDQGSAPMRWPNEKPRTAEAWRSLAADDTLATAVRDYERRLETPSVVNARRIPAMQAYLRETDLAILCTAQRRRSWLNDGQLEPGVSIEQFEASVDLTNSLKDSFQKRYQGASVGDCG